MADIELTKADGIATITFNRPEKRNAITQAMWVRFRELIQEADAANDVGLILVTGAGGTFIAGADLDEYETVHVTRESTIAYLAITSGAFETLASCSKPTIAMIEGACMGGGCMIAIACDLRFAAENARFCLPPSKLGLMFPLANTKRIVDVLGPTVTKDLLYSARVVEAPEALRMGLVSDVFTLDALHAATRARAADILGNSSWSVAKVKQVVARVLAGQSQETDETRGWLRDALASDDFNEGQTAFKEKRRPQFKFSAAARALRKPEGKP